LRRGVGFGFGRFGLFLGPFVDLLNWQVGDNAFGGGGTEGLGDGLLATASTSAASTSAATSASTLAFFPRDWLAGLLGRV
jgi:hypothetical protein